VVAPGAGGRIHRLWIQEATNHDPAAVLAALRVGPAQLICDALAVRAEADMVDPAKTV
jgi:hypothetical protein